MPLYITVELSPEQSDETALVKARKFAGLPKNREAAIYKKSIDARHGKLSVVYTVTVDCGEKEGSAIASRVQNARYRPESKYAPPPLRRSSETRPVVIGFGPAGMFAALLLAESGLRPLVLERGSRIDEREKKVTLFFDEGTLDTECNIQFGEGGAGLFSDGKLFTRVGDERCDYVLRRFASFGAPQEVVYSAHPHVGTDKLRAVVAGVREKIISLGGEIRYDTKMLDVETKNGKLCGIITSEGSVAAELAVLATGHSARDTFYAMNEKLALETKPFAVGVRIEHLREDIDRAMYGKDKVRLLGAAEYRLIHRGKRPCYTFCMCPGGVVIPAASEAGGVVTNGMSYFARDGMNSNSALVAAVDSKDFPSGGALAGIEFQRKIERAAFEAGGADYSAPVQRVSDYLNNRRSTGFGKVEPTYRRGTTFCDINSIMPEFINEAIKEAINDFNGKLRGFADSDAVITAPETRTSSPIRMPRHDNMYSKSVSGLIPCGEGAGYAGGIVSAAVDGLKAAEAVIYKINGEI